MASSEFNNNPLIIVTGGSKGIGAAIVKYFSEQQWNVIFTYANSEQAAKQIEMDCKNNIGTVKSYRCDGSDIHQVKEFSNYVLSNFGTPQALINNAGITDDNFAFDMNIDSWNNVLSTNLNACFYMVKQFLQPMIEVGNGSILFISSVSGIRGSSGQVNYSASKAGIIGMSKSLALEVARFGIRVNTIAPGFIETEMIQKIPHSEISKMKKSIPMRKIGQPNDVCFALDFLLSESSNYITGQVLVIDGGLTT